MTELKLLQKSENQINIKNTWKAKNEHSDPMPWEALKKDPG